MAYWQKRARVAVAIVGLLSAFAVYATFSGRRPAPPPPPIERSDRAAEVETSGSDRARFAGISKRFEIEHADNFFLYPDGSIKGINVIAVVPKGEDQTFTITASEVTRPGRSDDRISLTGSVRLEDDDGFFLTTERATYNGETSTAEADGAVAFGKGRMSGSGTGMIYQLDQDVLQVKQQARVTSTDESGAPLMRVTAGSARLDRLQHRLAVDTNVHIERESQVIDTDRAEAHLTAENDVVTFLQLRGNSRVSGGEAGIAAMSARDIDLDYTDDGQTLETVKLVGTAAIATTGTGGRPGLKIAGENIVDLALAPDGSLTRAVAREKVRVDLPPDEGTPQRSIHAEALDATGQQGRGLTEATFTRNVVFTEQAPGQGAALTSAPLRTARAHGLEARLADEAVTAATFTGDVTFEEVGLKACAGQLEYEPEKGMLALSGATRDGNPMVAEEQVAVEGQTIDVTLETRRMTADGTAKSPVKAVLGSASRRCAPSQSRPAGQQGANRMPRLLSGDSEVTVQGPHLEYDSRTGTAAFSGGRSTLRQGDTSIGAAELLIDQGKGNLTATGGAFSRLIVDRKTTEGRAHEIQYTDEDRRVRYAAAPKRDAKGAPPAAPSGAAGAARTEATLASEGSTLRATEYVELRLAADDNTVERMQAQGDVHVVEGNQTVTGGSRLDYDGKSERYDVTSSGARLVTVVIRENGTCRENSGRLVQFHKGREGMTIDGRGVQDTATAPAKSACAPAAR